MIVGDERSKENQRGRKGVKKRRRDHGWIARTRRGRWERVCVFGNEEKDMYIYMML